MKYFSNCKRNLTQADEILLCSHDRPILHKLALIGFNASSFISKIRLWWDDVLDAPALLQFPTSPASIFILTWLVISLEVALQLSSWLVSIVSIVAISSIPSVCGKTPASISILTWLVISLEVASQLSSWLVSIVSIVAISSIPSVFEKELF